MEEMMGRILVLNRRFITNSTKKCFIGSQNRSRNNPLQLCVACDCCFLDKKIINKQLHLLMLYLHIVKGCRDTPINIIWKIENPVGKSLSTYHGIKQGIENITKDVMKNIYFPPTTKYESMNWYVSLIHSIKFIFILATQLKVLAKSIKLGIFQETTKWVLWLGSVHRRIIVVMLMTRIIVRGT